MYDQNINELIQVTTMEIRLLRRPPSNKDILGRSLGLGLGPGPRAQGP